MRAEDAYSILVNTTDSFEDCWNPFFLLFEHYWPNCANEIILNTERKNFEFDDLRLRCAKNMQPQSAEYWSECLFKCLSIIPSDILLYLQDDYFINGPVKRNYIDEFSTIMRNAPVSHILLMPLGLARPFRQSPFHPLLVEIPLRSPYRVSLQAGLWKKERLLHYLRRGESAWQFERRGTVRSYGENDIFLACNPEFFNEANGRVVPYIPTGIVRGQWLARAVVDLFRENGIDVDFGKRGFHQERNRDLLKARIRALGRRTLYWMLACVLQLNRYVS